MGLRLISLDRHTRNAIQEKNSRLKSAPEDRDDPTVQSNLGRARHVFGGICLAGGAGLVRHAGRTAFREGARAEKMTDLVDKLTARPGGLSSGGPGVSPNLIPTFYKLI